jgi:ABC-type nitrate/sulfonate/bicarbonate transport system substrate-binding protein
MKTKLTIMIAVLAAIVLAAVFWKASSRRQPGTVTVRYGITPYQDSGLPVVPERLGWYKEAGINVELVPVTWGDVITAMSGNAIDVAIYNFNSFQAPYENAAKGTAKPVFYCPVFLFKGQAIMVRTNSGMEGFREVAGESKEQRDERIVRTAKQLKGKRIAVTEGTELDQIVLAALKKAELSKQDVTLIHASPEDSLAAFLAGNVDAFAAGLTERVEARRRGATELLLTADVMLPVVDGIITSEAFATKHPEVMEKLAGIWFRTIRFMEEDLNKNSAHIRDYLSKAASTRYSPEEYAVAWTFNVFPHDPKEANKLFNDPASSAYWKTAWDANNEFLKQQSKVQGPVPYSAYWGEKVLQRLSKE